MKEIKFVSCIVGVDGYAIKMEFELDGKTFYRTSLLKDSGNFEAGQLLWWKCNDEYLENEMHEYAEEKYQQFKKEVL